MQTLLVCFTFILLLSVIELTVHLVHAIFSWIHLIRTTRRSSLVEYETKMEDWISVLLFLSLPIFNSAGSFLDTACITHNPLGNPSNHTTFIGVVVYNGRDTFRSYRRAATTKKFDSHSYPTLGNTSCNISTVKDTNASRSCGFYSYIHIISQFEVEPLINGEEVVLGRSYNRTSLQNDLRFGVFQCIASQQEHSSISTVTIMPEAAEFKPPAFTITANLDERVTLKMLASDSNSTQVRWRYSWGSVTRELSEWEGNTTPVIEKVNTSDAGVYEAYTTSSTDSGYVRLIVRGCRYNLWGSPSCQWTCPVCYNGGICDDVSGGCVCPPGFTGGQCEQACPSGYIGRRCGISCATVIGVADCRGVEICLPHPFGCSCAPGFTGLDCQTVCDQGAYGAGCTEVCHCQSMSQCDSKTGLCSESGCERSWKGPMCQAKVFDVVGYGRPAAFQIGGPFTVEGLTTLDMDTSVKLLIGRELDTGSGTTGSGISNENANLTTIPSTSGLPAGTLQFTANGEHYSRLKLETVSSNYSHLGVYYVELINGKRRQHTQILRQANIYGAVRFERFTLSVGTGESVTMAVSYYPPPSSTLRWRHNGREIPLTNGNTELTIDYARKADEGVYECFPENRDQSYKGFMILKVRACPSGFWGIYCNITCPVCYYQGICHEETGQCVCQPGYHGDDCSQVCDHSSNAIGMTCDLNCTTRPELGHKCLYKQVCSPHPVGCHCRAGFGSVPKCNDPCTFPNFGVNCAMTARCRWSLYNAVSGCTSSPCIRYYEGPGCQRLVNSQACRDGYYGSLCNYICHCADSINCNRTTGSCGRGGCAEGWGGLHCQNALPALSDAPSITVVEEGIQVSWNLWRPGYDYGTGPVDSYRVTFGLTNISTEQQERTHEDTINNYLTLTGLDIAGYYSINVSVIKIIQGQRAVGQSSPSAVVCMSTEPPTNVNAEPTLAEERISFTVSWEDICPSTEFTYEVHYRPATGDGSDSVQTVQSERSVTITNGLLQCTEYLVSVRRNAEGSNGDRSAEDTVLTDSEDPTAMPRDIRATLLHGINPVRILVSWTPVNVTKLNLKCDPRTTDYTYGVYYEDAENVSGYNISTLSSSTNVTIADGTLSQCTEYLISVGIKNAVGRVNMTSPVTVRTDSGDPTVRISVTAQKTGRVDQLQVSWSTNFINRTNLKCNPDTTDYTYEVYYRPTNETRAQNVSVWRSEMSVTISNLQQCTVYSISVRIRNAVGRKSEATEPTSIRTNSEAPSIIPREVRAHRGAMVGTRPQITVTWTVDSITSENLKCDPTTTEYFFVVYYQETSGWTQRSKLISGRNSMSTTITEQLSQCTNYSISVSVRNAAGIEGNSSSNIYIQTDSEDPTVAISDVTAQKTGRVDQLQVSWFASNINQTNLKCNPDTGYTYEVYYHPRYENGEQNISSRGSQRSLTISNLQQCTEYSISVSIRNAVGQKSRATGPTFVRTKSDAPSIKPRDVRAQRGRMLGTGPQITVTWTVDAITSGNLKCDPTTTEYSFVVYYQEMSGGTQGSKVIPGRHSMDTIISEGLRQCTYYSISVSVRNAAGIEGNKSSDIYIQTDSEDPTVAISDVTAQKTGRVDQLQVSWSASSIYKYYLKCYPSTGYTFEVYYNATYETRAQNISTTGSQTSLTISDLQQCTVYSISVSIRNAVGRKGRATEPITVRTKSEAPSIIPRDVRAQRGPMLRTMPQIAVTWTVDAITSENLKCDPTTTEYSFVVYYQEASGGTQRSKLISGKHSMDTTITERLRQCTNYSISVSVRNAAEIEGSHSSNTYIQTDSEDPSTVFRFTTTRLLGVQPSPQVRVSWPGNRLSTYDLRCDPSLGYTVIISYWPKGEGGVLVKEVDNAVENVNISGLKACTYYKIAMDVRNFIGRQSNNQLAKEVLTDSEDPTTRIEFNVSRINDTNPGKIQVTWTPVNVTKLNLKCDPRTTDYTYEVYYEDAGNGNETVITTTNSSTNVTISDGTLSQCTEYLISVGIKNAVGRVNRTSPVTVRTDSEDPTVAIYGVTAQKTGRVDQLQVSWSTNSINQNNLKCMPYTGYTYEVHYHPTDETRAQNISSRGSQRSLTISNLQTCTEYSISVSIRNAVGRKSRATYPTVVRTKSEAPSIIPRDIRAQRGPLVGTRPIIAVTWAVDAITSENLKCDPTTTEYSFIVYYQGGGTQRSKEIPGRHSMGTTITERLSQCTNYSISVSVRNAAGIEGNNSSNTYLQTDSEDPSTVFRFTTTRLLGVQPSPQVRVSWPGNRLSTYDLRCDPSLGYTVIISYWPKGEGGVLVKEVDNAVENVNISGLKACTYYKIAMDVRNFIGHESNNQQLAKEVLTDSEDPTTRIEFNVSRINDTNSGQIQVTWTTDAVSFQNLKCDPSLGYDVILRYGESTGNLQKEFVTAEGINRHTLSNLLMCTEYAVSVVIRNIVDRESQNNVKKHVITDSEDVKVTPTNVYTSDVSQTSIELSWQPPESLDYTSMGCHPKYPYKYEISYRSQNFSSVTTILDQSQQEYKFTDLEPGSSYIFYLRLTNYAGRSGPYAVIECNTTVTADVLPFVLGVTFPSVFLIISLLVLVVYLITSPSRSNQCWAIRRGRIQDDNGFIEEEHSEMRTFERDQQIPNVCSSRGKTIHRHELPSYVKEQHLKEGGFHDEYKELIQGKYTSCTVAEAKINERKNRFKNVLTYDHSRVVLPLINGDSSSDYINASYIHGYKKQNAFIACQSPNKASLHDFWRMIWHEKCTKIIMVALPIENGKMKCLTYWLDTDSAPQQYSNISIERTGETASINLMIRHFKLQLGSRIHEVTQYHYFGRPDMKVPQSADILWDIIDEVEKDEDENSPPIVVHCSAGCGWTGTVIALASLRKMMKQEEAIDVFNFVNNMRKQRPLMVQVVEQYQFIFESLLINSYVGKPSTPVDDFHVNLRKWKAVTSLHKQTGLQRQFNMLSFVSPFPEDSENQVGLLSENIVKNRYPVIIPRNKFRPTLVTFVEDKTATDYINASFCDGYSKKDLFISTQLPLPNTILDFWRMVIDYKVATIVTFEAHQTWLNYLPSEGAYQYGPFSVRVMELTQEDDITTRVLRISMDHSTYQNGKGLRMWITNISLSSPSLSSFVSLIEKTQAVQRQNENRRIVVQCLDGVSQCGMFMAVYNCCTGIIVDKVIDLFTMVRKLRERRPEMVGTLEQYEFCTQAISKRLSTSSVYANE
ncbi:uncharacterized protein [Apostichopus japonicus]|uniref:uncharacterized protein isoform X1 n=1 Tax=Stichopus japonicus TaxID=307972 RepID=UPI003AB6825E